ncbi:hypothetical protein [Chitinimonas sp.]|uniref:hypothetical protein n=1 Tax=Chitinimonas sp. TaxID=1934313 RepID=UPI0035B48EB7
MLATLLERLEEVFDALRGETFVLEIVQQTADVLVIQGGRQRFSFSKTSRSVSANGKRLARFDEIEWIDIGRARKDDDGPERWWVRLKLRGWFATIPIGASPIDADASIVAARISTYTGKAVRAL